MTMTLSINIPITEQDIKHVRQKAAASEHRWTVRFKGFAKFCHCGVIKASPGKFVPDLQAFHLIFKRQFHALNDKF